MKTAAFIAAALVALYVVVVGVLTLDQRALIYHPHLEEVAPNFPGVRALRLRTSDNESLVAWYLPPATVHDARGPIFLFFDGNAGRPEVWAGRWRRIAEGGGGFLAVYYRGYSGASGHPSEPGLYADAEAGYQWLTTHGYGANDIVIHGVSLGSGVAVHLAAMHPARALILEAPFTSVVDVVAHYFPLVPSFCVRERFMSRDLIGRVHMPVLIAHGDADTVIPFAEGQQLFAIANEPKQFVRMHGSDHTTLTRDGLYDHIWPFLAEHPRVEPARADAQAGLRITNRP